MASRRKKDNQRRVVVTGLGVVSSIGIGWQEFWKNLIAGKSGISKIESFDTSEYDRHYGGEVKNFDPSKFLSRQKIKYIGRSSQMGIAATKLALEDAKVEIKKTKNRNISICIGMTMAEMQVLEGYHNLMYGVQGKQYPKELLLIFPANVVGLNIATELNVGGYNYIFGNACASGNYSLGQGYDLIMNGKADFALVGGSDSFSRIVFTGFNRLYSIAPEKCQPFDAERKGMIPAEGAGVLFLETYESAKVRKVPIYAEVLGYGLSCDARHMTNPFVEGIARAMQKALNNANVPGSAIDYICAHGTGTVENDKAECRALEIIFRERLKSIPVSSIKSMLGHTMGAASALESIACCLAITKGIAPPTINYMNPDVECRLNVVPNNSQKHKMFVVMNNSSAFGGNNSCVVFARI